MYGKSMQMQLNLFSSLFKEAWESLILHTTCHEDKWNLNKWPIYTKLVPEDDSSTI